MTTVIKNATVVSPADGLNGANDILIENGRIAAVGQNLSGDREINAAGLYAVPGLVDMHVHLRDPGQTAKEDILTGCNAAAAGGVTSLLAMPNTNPAADSPETVRYILDKAKEAKARVYVAASITKGLQGKEPTDLQALRDAGAVGLSDDGKLGMTEVAHCEDLSLAEGGKINEGAVREALGVKGIPAAAEDCGTAREIALAAADNVPVHICHVSTRTSVALVRDAKRRGVKVTAETAPHYFSLTEQALMGRDADFRMNPPLRTAADVQAIIEGLQDGTLDAIATDHAPHTPEDKADFEKAPNGSIGMETSLAVGVTYLVKPGLLSFSQLIEKMSANPAKLLGIPAGTLAVGAPADSALVDLNREWTVDVNRLHGKSKNTPFKGMTLTGKVVKTFLGGEVVFDEAAD